MRGELLFFEGLCGGWNELSASACRLFALVFFGWPGFEIRAVGIAFRLKYIGWGMRAGGWRAGGVMLSG